MCSLCSRFNFVRVLPGMLRRRRAFTVAVSAVLLLFGALASSEDARGAERAAAATLQVPATSATALAAAASGPPGAPDRLPDTPPATENETAGMPGCADLDEGTPAAGADASLSARIKGALAAGNLVVALFLVLVGGFLTALSPCVYPLIPITLSILGARQAESHFRGFLLAATYVAGMVILYSALGVGFAAAGLLAGSALQSPIITVGVALLCIAMAASMFGAFELALPSALQTRLAQVGGGGFRGAFVMGLVAGIIAAPCTGPVLSFILTVIARDGDVLKGGVLMVAYALGMGLPFLVLGTFSQAIARMPRSGRWMEVVKSVFGLLMLGAGLYYLRLGVAPLAATLEPLGRAAWLGPALLAAGIGLGALHLSFKAGSARTRARKGTGVALATAGLVAMLAWANSAPAPRSDEAGPAITWTEIKNTRDAVTRFDEALAAAKRACRPVMVDFFAEWCTACKELDHKTYPDASVRAEAQRFTAVKVDATHESAELEAIQARYGVVGLPTIVFINGRGRVLQEPHVTGFVAADAYVDLMRRVR